MIRSNANRTKGYLLLLKADEFLRDRCIAAALRRYAGPVVGMAPTPAFPKNRFFDHVLKGDPHLATSALQAVQAFEKESGLRPDAVVPVTEMSLHPALEIAEHYRLPFLPRQCVDRARNKDLMKDAFLAAGLPTSKYRKFRDLQGLEKAVEALGLPIIVKPCAAAHSIGVIRIDRREEIASAFEYCRRGLDEVKDAWRIDNPWLQAEEYFDAEREVSVEVAAANGKIRVVTVTEKYLTPPPYFAEVGHMVPSLDADNVELKEMAVRACESLGIDRGVCHVEVRVNAAGKLSLIEVAARPGGDGIMDLVERAHGVNMYDLHIAAYLGVLEALPEPPPLLGVSAIAFMQTKRGVVRRVSVSRDLPSEIVSLYVNKRPGERVGDSLNYDDRAGTVELFWPNERKNLGRRHLDAADGLAREIFDVE